MAKVVYSQIHESYVCIHKNPVRKNSMITKFSSKEEADAFKAKLEEREKNLFWYLEEK